MPKVMVFIDGTWLYYNKSKLADLAGKDEYQIDYGKLPEVLAKEVAEHCGGAPVDVVRTFLFGSYPANFDDRDREPANRRRDFFDMLREKYHYEVNAFPIDFHGRRLKRAERDDDDPFEPREKCVDIALASSVLYYAAIPNAYDIAVVVIGDQDFLPLLQHTRRLGKRVLIASIHGSCCPEFADPCDRSAVKDFSTVWLDERLEELELTFKRQRLRCESPLHVDDPMVWTTYQLRPGEKFYCDACRAEFTRLKQLEAEVEAEEALAGNNGHGGNNGDHGHGGNGNPGSNGADQGDIVEGMVKTIFQDRGFGFIQGHDGRDYFFHLSDLSGGYDFADLVDGIGVSFEVKRPPNHRRAGAAQNVAVGASMPYPRDVG